MGMVLLARELVTLGVKVALAANSTPALNDITAAELEAFVALAAEHDSVVAEARAAGRLRCLDSGQRTTLLDLGRCGEELVSWVRQETEGGVSEERWLVVLDGMGRSLESKFVP